MMAEHLDPVVAALGGLVTPAPPGLTGKVFGGWLAAPSQLGEVFVVFTSDGVQLLRSAESVHGDPDTFAEVYRDRFGRPLRRAEGAPDVRALTQGGAVACRAGNLDEIAVLAAQGVHYLGGESWCPSSSPV